MIKIISIQILNHFQKNHRQQKNRDFRMKYDHMLSISLFWPLFIPTLAIILISPLSNQSDFENRGFLFIL